MTDFNEEFKERSPFRVIKKILRFTFTTNSAIWFEKDLTEELADYQAKIPVEFDITSISQTIEWLKSQEQSWLVHPKEIATAFEYNHFWPSVRTNEQIIGCMKIGFGNVYIADYDKVIEFSEKMAFIYESYILQDYRKKALLHIINHRFQKYSKY